MKYKKWIWQIVLFLLIIAIMASCYGSKVITGEITAVRGQEVQCRGKWFKVEGIAPQVGKTVSFTPTKDSSKVNSIKLK